MNSSEIIALNRNRLPCNQKGN